jgi:hypothetical protein
MSKFLFNGFLQFFIGRADSQIVPDTRWQLIDQTGGETIFIPLDQIIAKGRVQRVQQTAVFEREAVAPFGMIILTEERDGDVRKQLVEELPVQILRCIDDIYIPSVSQYPIWQFALVSL